MTNPNEIPVENLSSEPTPLLEGQPAPDFALPDENGKTVRLSDFRGRRLILYFYPKDDTPGCTLEASNFRDDLEAFEQRKAAIVGVSMDDVESHRRFKERYQLNFPLLSDQKRDVLRRYGVLKEKSVVGVPFRWAERTTFVIDENGIIRRIFRKVQVTHHIREILDALGLPA